jgi:hypothetical protein
MSLPPQIHRSWTCPKAVRPQLIHFAMLLPADGSTVALDVASGHPAWWTWESRTALPEGEDGFTLWANDSRQKNFWLCEGFGKLDQPGSLDNMVPATEVSTW